ncbi:DUF1772 domain-containing protein [Lacimicrobium alkaliphilum]|uniref:DUF1772 domain-containing protein n=1 Tax=Lacimicrobium alkaliphilum TaxID=1526571 RepID=A0ABQ1RRP2_9ALTE|nr:DUF1772 domain-containing protein [Lacimicrobium alkaliphilum]GGD78066.1 hypothetical protein GCM10011357_36460 [Lacimicrobium alkaliphilum]
MLAAAQFVAMFCALMFTGAAVYINLVEHPTRLSFSNTIALSIWESSYKRATRMQAPLALISGFSAAGVWWLSGSLLWLLASVLILLVVPFTFAIIMPVNTELQRADLEPESVRARKLLETWGRLHSVRSILAMVASSLMLTQLVSV